ncbi:menaquinone-dependent protoporphyrinogen IX dehydrogenase [Sansalvadorimonas verongulae]|uniref:menaquinone-dependent protoporphyrinogen IX dehydrogenase n=1 Tax=Sansalvadorimonas verongulae TaxID=2172824 RepID=UPI002E32DC51|nr:menaquinone-dependent protoporphyrinogen IX dehydrogenase [Sansalvadorimonas verongulae]
MSRHLILYASHDGQTASIARAISKTMSAEGLDITLSNIEEKEDSVTLSDFDSVLIGSPIRYGHHLPAARKFIENHQSFLNAVESGFFSVNLTARKPEKQDPDTNRYMQRFLKTCPWKPGYLGVLAGSLQYSRYRWFDRVMIQLIMKITGGSTDASKDIEFTSWQRVEAFAKGYAEYLHSKSIC